MKREVETTWMNIVSKSVDIHKMLEMLEKVPKEEENEILKIVSKTIDFSIENNYAIKHAAR